MTERLSPEQERAVAATDPVAVVVACPGAGKTRVYVERILRSKHPEGLTCLSFTNAAADEIRARLERDGFPVNRLRYLGTLHSFCITEMSRLGTMPQILGDDAKDEAIADVVRVLGAPARNMSQKEMWSYAMAVPGFGAPKSVGAAIRAWFRNKSATHVDFILPDFFRVIGKVTPPEELMVDETQDSGEDDWDIYRYFRDAGTRLFVVGDIRQSIYAFRRAVPELMIEEAMTGTEYNLSTNYRSGPNICAYANKLAKLMWDGSFVPMVPAANDAKDWVDDQSHDSAEEEALWAAERCAEAAEDHRSIAVIMRYNDQTRQVASILRAKGLTLAASTDRELDAAAVPWLSRIMVNLGTGTDMPEDWQDYLTRMGVPFEQQRVMLPLLRRCRCVADIAGCATDEPDTADAGCFVGTIHSAKGREWEEVLVLGCDAATYHPNDSESLRILYVAATRARRRLTLSWARSRVQPGSGRRITVEPSIYLP